MPDIIRPCMVSNRDDGMPRPRLSDRVCCPRAMMACHAQHLSTRCMLSKSNDGIHARRILTMCIGQRTLLHATPDILRSCILSKGDDVMRRLTSSHRVCCPRLIDCQMTSGVSCHHYPWTTHTIGRNRAWQTIIDRGQQTRACYHCPMLEHTIG